MFCVRYLFCSLGLAAMLLGSSTATAQDQTRFVLKLDSKLISSLRSYGSLRSQVPEKSRNKISFVELQFDETKDEESIELGLPVLAAGENATIVLDEDLIGQVKGQPVRVPIDGSDANFSQIILRYEAPAISTLMGGSEEDMHFIRMKDAKVMAGNVDGFDQLTLESSFGPVTIPMTEIAGIKFHSDSKDSAVAVLNNGDTVTGKPNVPTIMLETDWGKAEIEPEFIESLTTGSTARFLQETGDFGSRWSLRTGTSVAPGAAPAEEN